MSTLQKFLFLSCLMSLFVACNKGKFKTKDSDFQHIYNDLVKSRKSTDVTWDAEVHSYTFTLSENKTVKYFGYQSHSSLSTTDYIIEIIRNSDSVIVYSGGHQFSSSALSYVTPNSVIQLQSGQSYTINRIQTNWGQYITETIGHIVRTEENDYPMINGAMTVTSSCFHDDGVLADSWQKFRALPRIDLVFD